MPLFDYKCPDCGAVQECLVPVSGIPSLMPCECGGNGARMPAAPTFDLEWARPPIDNVQEVWGDSDTDGVNETQYESTTAFMEI